MNYTHSAALWIVDSGVGTEELRVVNETLAELSANKRVLFGASMLALQDGVSSGIGVRMLGWSAEELQQCCLSAWNVLRPILINKPPLRLRK